MLQRCRVPLGDLSIAVPAGPDRQLGCRWMRHRLGRVPAGQRALVAAHLRTIFAQDTREAAHQQGRKVAGGLRERLAKLAELMDGAEPDVLVHRSCAKEHGPQLASTHPLERVNGEIKRRTNLVGISPNLAAVVRLVGAILREHNDAWAVARRYRTLETLRPSTAAELVSLPAVVS